MTTARYEELTDDAGEAYNQARYREAALLHEQARHLAQQQRLSREAFYSATWAAVSWDLTGDPLRSLNLLSELLREVPAEADVFDVWIARKRAFEVQRTYFPRLAALQQRLTELETLQREQPQLPPADVHDMYALLLQHQGQWAENLRHCESAWNLDDGKSGFAKYLFAYKALLANLYLNNPTAARDWCTALGETETHIAGSRASWQEAQAQLALYRQQPQQAAQHAAALEELCAGIDDVETAHKNLVIQIRTRLLQTPPDDPQAPNHPARRRFVRRIAGKPVVFDVYNRRLLLLDYRLACVRRALGVAAVDDLWYTRPHDLSQAALRMTPREAQRRVFLARRAVKRALGWAEYLDGCFETLRWTQEVAQHAQRLEELAGVLRGVTVD